MSDNALDKAEKLIQEMVDGTISAGGPLGDRNRWAVDRLLQLGMARRLDDQVLAVEAEAQQRAADRPIWLRDREVQIEATQDLLAQSVRQSVAMERIADALEGLLDGKVNRDE